MPFNPSNNNFLNRTVFVYPVHGYGWQLTDNAGSHSIEPLKQFKIQLLEFFYAENQPTVACGRVASDDPLLANWWVTLVAIIDDAQVMLDAEAGSCGTLVCPEKPTFDATIRPVNVAKVVRTDSLPRYSGISFASLSLDVILKKIASK